MNQEKSGTVTYELTFLRILYQNKIKIIIISIIAGIITAGLSLLIPNTYRSSAALLIQEPEVTLTGEAAPLSIETLKFLAESTTVKRELFENVNETRIFIPKIAFRDFQDKLKTQTVKKTGRNLELLPIMILSVDTEQPEHSMKIANLWSDIVLEKSRSIYVSGVKDLSEFTSRIYQRADSSLIKAEEEETSAIMAASLETNQNRLDDLRKHHSKIYSENLDLKDSLNTNLSLLDEYNSQKEEQVIDTIWAGEYFYTKLSNGPLADSDDYTSITKRIYSIVKQIVEDESNLAEFEKNSRLQFLNIDLNNKIQQMDQISNNLVDAKNQYARSSVELEKLEQELQNLDSTITLNKAITDDELWSLHSDGKLNEKSEFPILKDEEINLAYFDLKKKSINLKSSLSGMKSSIEDYEKQRTVIDKEVSVLASELTRKNAEKQSLEQALKRKKEFLDFMENEFKKLEQQSELLVLKSNELQSKIDAKDSQINVLSEEMKDLEEYLFTNQFKITVLKRDVENNRKLHASIAAKVDEIDLLEISAENASRSGVVLFYEAEANPEKIKPSRSKLVLAVMSIALLLASTFIILKETFEGSSVKEN